jgi:deoxyadenosine/deoxycytidine kinase
MVSSLKVDAGVGKRMQKPPRVVEIVGPAGAGKTTLYAALDQHPERVLLGDFPDVRKLSAAPFYIFHGLGLVPSLAWLYRHPSRQLTRREFAWMAVLRGWAGLLKKDTRRDKRVIVLDQGPVYLMAELRLSGPDYLQAEKARALWESLFTRWASTLDLIIWLDAADDVLLDRIRTRPSEHLVKKEDDATIQEFLGRFRRNYEGIFARLQVNSTGPAILRLDSGTLKPEEIEAAVLTELNGKDWQVGA